jgi:hypothetical protein
MGHRSSTQRIPLQSRRLYCGTAMPRTYFTFGDIEGKFDVLRVECTKCERKGRYSVAKLIERHGRRGNMSAWVRDLKGDCPHRDAHSLNDRCDVLCPDLTRPPVVGMCLARVLTVNIPSTAPGIATGRLNRISELLPSGRGGAAADR